jgi:hypothetical protein
VLVHLLESLAQFLVCGSDALNLTYILVGHPLDTIKVRLQTQNHYKSAIDCAVQLFRNEGVRINLSLVLQSAKMLLVL